MLLAESDIDGVNNMNVLDTILDYPVIGTIFVAGAFFGVIYAGYRLAGNKDWGGYIGALLFMGLIIFIGESYTLEDA